MINKIILQFYTSTTVSSIYNNDNIDIFIDKFIYQNIHIYLFINVHNSNIYDSSDNTKSVYNTIKSRTYFFAELLSAFISRQIQYSN